MSLTSFEVPKYNLDRQDPSKMRQSHGVCLPGFLRENSMYDSNILTFKKKRFCTVVVLVEFDWINWLVSSIVNVVWDYRKKPFNIIFLQDVAWDEKTKTTAYGFGSTSIVSNQILIFLTPKLLKDLRRSKNKTKMTKSKRVLLEIIAHEIEHLRYPDDIIYELTNQEVKWIWDDYVGLITNQKDKDNKWKP